MNRVASGTPKGAPFHKNEKQVLRFAQDDNSKTQITNHIDKSLRGGRGRPPHTTESYEQPLVLPQLMQR